MYNLAFCVKLFVYSKHGTAGDFSLYIQSSFLNTTCVYSTANDFILSVQSSFLYTTYACSTAGDCRVYNLAPCVQLVCTVQLVTAVCVQSSSLYTTCLYRIAGDCRLYTNN